MGRSTKHNTLRMMVIYGWQLNPYIEYVVQALAEQGAKVLLITRKTFALTSQNKLYSVHKIFPGTESTKPHHLITLGILECVALVRLAILVLTQKPDVIHFSAIRIPYIDWIFFIFLKLIKKKVALTVHDTQSHQSLLDDFIIATLSRYCDILFVHTAHSKRYLQEVWKLNASKIYVVPHGGYHTHVTPMSQDAARKQLGYQDSDYILLCFGSVRKYKGIDYLLRSAALAKEYISNIRVIIAGKAFDKNLDKYYRQLISDLNLNNEVAYNNRFIEDEEVPSLFCSCDLVVLPYTYIDQSGVLCLAYTYSKPVIATRVGGLPEMIRESKTGYVVPPADTRALTDAILTAWSNRARLSEMGVQAHQLILDAYSWERYAELTIDAYRNSLSERARSMS